MDRAILYSFIEDISVWSKTKMIDSDCRFCLRIVTNECIYFFQVNSLHLRDQWFYSIQWKVCSSVMKMFFSSFVFFFFLEKQIKI